MMKQMTQAAMEANLNFDSEEHPYEVPKKRINDNSTMERFQQSPLARDLTMFIIETQKSVKTTKMTETVLDDRLKPFIDYLDKIDVWLDEVPPIEQPMRFGNKAFRTWLDRIIENGDADLQVICAAGNPEFKNLDRAIPELKQYLVACTIVNSLVVAERVSFEF